MNTILNSAAGNLWRHIGIKNHHGINIPLFALRSRNSCGIGEFPDLIPLIDWCKRVGFDVIQLLPLNDSGPETSPYCSMTASALNPLHLGLAHLPFLDSIDKLHELQQLSTCQRIDYPTLHKRRETFLSEYYQSVGAKLTMSEDYRRFVSQNPWIDVYALFKAIKIERQWQPWEEWPPALSHPTEETYKQLLKEYHEAIEYHRCIQFLCFEQFKNVKKHAETQGVFLKGDIPILINRESADVWAYSFLFHLDFVAGAPPDMYSKEGQYWGFPLYDWSMLEQQDYAWWKERLRVASELYHIYRLDHIVGFFRIWGIPEGMQALEGLFIPSNKSQWIPQGEKILRMMLKSCPMLPIGEDLGTIPPEVRVSLSHLGICGTKVMRWERLWKEDDQPYIDPKDYPALSMTTVSTHDSETVRQWWRDHPDEADDYAASKGWVYHPILSDKHHYDILWDSHHSGSLFHINLLQEYLFLVPDMTWPDIEDERINTPGIISDKNWTYRFCQYVEQIVENKILTDIITTLINNKIT